MSKQVTGNYHELVMNCNPFIREGYIVNHVANVEVKITEDLGRGVFAAKDFKKGDLIIVEKALIELVLPTGEEYPYYE